MGHHINGIQATVNEGLAQGPYMAARVGFEPATLRTEGAELTTGPPHPVGMDWKVNSLK